MSLEIARRMLGNEAAPIERPASTLTRSDLGAHVVIFTGTATYHGEIEYVTQYPNHTFVGFKTADFTSVTAHIKPGDTVYFSREGT